MNKIHYVCTYVCRYVRTYKDFKTCAVEQIANSFFFLLFFSLPFQKFKLQLALFCNFHFATFARTFTAGIFVANVDDDDGVDDVDDENFLFHNAFVQIFRYFLALLQLLLFKKNGSGCKQSNQV